MDRQCREQKPSKHNSSTWPLFAITQNRSLPHHTGCLHYNLQSPWSSVPAHGPQSQSCSSWTVNQYCSFLSRFHPTPQCTQPFSYLHCYVLLAWTPWQRLLSPFYPKSVEEQPLASNQDPLSFGSEPSTCASCSPFQSFAVFFVGLLWGNCELGTPEGISQSLKWQLLIQK